MLSHRAAGALWGIVRGATPTEVLLPSMHDRRARDGILVHRGALPPEHVTRRDGVPVTTLLRTLLDLAAVLRTRRLAHAFEEAQVNEKFGPWTPDFLWPDHQVVVETDGVDFHRTAAKRARDRRKDVYLTAHSLSVTRLTWSDVTERPNQTARRVAAALSR